MCRLDSHSWAVASLELFHTKQTTIHCLLRSGSSLLAAHLLLGLGLDGALGSLHGGGTGNGGLTEVGTVTSLGDMVGNVLVGPVQTSLSSIHWESPKLIWWGYRGGCNVLAVVTAERDFVGGLSGLVDRLGLLRVEDQALLAVKGNTNSLVVHETGML